MRSFEPLQPKRSLLSTRAVPTSRLLPLSRPLVTASSLLRPSRPLVSSPPLVSEPAAPPPIQERLEHSTGLGHSIERLSLFPPEKKNNTGLPDTLKTGIENLSGLSLNDVHVHYNSPKPAQVQAFAYTQGNNIHIGPRQEKHLAHEAWHVVQQKQGRAQPTMQMKGVAINDDPSLEHEADEMGAKVQCMHNQSLPERGSDDRVPLITHTQPLIQRVIDQDSEDYDIVYMQGNLLRQRVAPHLSEADYQKLVDRITQRQNINTAAEALRAMRDALSGKSEETE